MRRLTSKLAGGMSRGPTLRLAAIVAVLVVLSSCGRVASTPSGSQAATTASTPSPTSTPSATSTPTPPPQSVPDASQLTASNCAGASPNTPPRSAGSYFTIQPVGSWGDTGDYAHSETLLVELTAPNSYGFAPSKIQFHSDLGPVHTVYGSQATAHSIAQQHAAAIKQDTNSSQGVAGTVRDCTVGGQPAAAFGYSDGTNFGYRVFVVHKDLLFEIWLFGAGGLANQTVQDALGMIGSLSWTS